MEDVIVACMQPRWSVVASREDFLTFARRFMRQAQAKSAQLAVFPELTGLMLAPPLMSRFKLGFIKQAHRGRQPGAGFMARRMGSVAGATAGVLGGGFAGNLSSLLLKNGDALQESYLQTFGDLAREFGMTVVAGSLYLKDADSGSLRNRAYVFSPAGEVLGTQDKLNLAPEEKDLAAPGTGLTIFELAFGRFGLLIGRDVLYPELPRLAALKGAALLVSIAAAPGAEQAGALRCAAAVRAEENQFYVAASYLLGPNFLDPGARDDYAGQSALLAPRSLTQKRDGILLQAGSSQAETIVTATLSGSPLQTQRESGWFRPRQEMNLGGLGPVLAEMYEQGLTIEQAIEQSAVPAVAVAAEPVPEWRKLEPEPEPEPTATILEAPAPAEPERIGADVSSQVSPPEELPQATPDAPPAADSSEQDRPESPSHGESEE